MTEKPKMNGVSNIARDIRERKREEDTRHESEERFQLVANTAPVMIWIADVHKQCTYLNQRWLEFTGRPLKKELGNGWAESVHPEDLAHCLEQSTKAFDQHEAFQVEYRLRRCDGQYRWLLGSGVPRFDAGGSFAGYIGSAADVTEHKLAEAALSTMNQRLIEAQDQERARIARELHDDIVQRLLLLMMNLTGVVDSTSLNEIRDCIHRSIHQASDLASDMRTLSHRLHSSILDYVGLETAASAWCRELSERHKVKISLHTENIPPDLSREVSLCLFRVLQEGLQNAIKHSGSRHFRVSLKGGPRIELAVRDTGTGFKPELASRGRGLGLSSMRERLKLVKGTVSIDSKLGRGTTIHAWVPLSARHSANERTANRQR